MNNRLVKKIVSFLLKLLIGIAILVFVIYKVDFSLAQIISNVKSPIYLVFALLIPLIINPLISSNRWKVFLKVQGIEESSVTLMKYNFISIFLGLVLPSTSGSDALRILFIEKKHPAYRGKGGASVIFERLIGFIILSFLGFLGALLLFFNTGSSIEVLITFVIFVILLSILFMFKSKKLFSIIMRFFEKIKRWQKVTVYLKSLYLSINLFPINKVLLFSIPLILAFQLSTIVCGYLIFKSFDVNMPFYYHLAFLPLIQILTIIPITISGFGIREGGFVYFYSILGIDGGVSIAVSLLYYFIISFLPSVLGMILYFYDLFKLKQNLYEY
jgi:uncharacterized protein (TIRG00374 family)